MMSANKQNIVKGSRGHTSRAEAMQGHHHRTQQEFFKTKIYITYPGARSTQVRDWRLFESYYLDQEAFDVCNKNVWATRSDIRNG